jgi:hypothetical protein
MKNKLPACIFVCVFVCACLLLWPRHKGKSYAVAKLAPAQVREQTIKLEKLIIPPKGTSLQDVEAVYGKTSLNDPSEIVKGKKELLYWLYLLPASKGGDFRAILLMRVEDGKIAESSVNHFCVMKNRKQMPIPHDAQSRQMVKAVQAQLQAETRGVLDDLLQIQDRYSQNLKTASWNRPKPQTIG